MNNENNHQKTQSNLVWNKWPRQMFLGNLLIANVFEDMGIKKENKRFLPHVRLVARIKQPILHKRRMKLFQTIKRFGPEEFLVSKK